MDLLKIELKKLVNYRTFWVLVALYVIIFFIVLTGLENLMGNVTFDGEKPPGFDPASLNINVFPGVWHNLSFVAGYFRFILAVIVIISVTNEYTYRTVRQNIIDGLSRIDFLISKLWGVILLSLGSTLLLFAICLVLGYKNTPKSDAIQVFDNAEYIIAYFVEVTTYLIIALFLSLAIRKSGLTIGLLLLYSFIIEPLASLMLPPEVSAFFPISALDNLIQAPFRQLFTDTYQGTVAWKGVGIAAAHAFIFTALSYFVLKQNDL